MARRTINIPAKTVLNIDWVKKHMGEWLRLKAHHEALGKDVTKMRDDLTAVIEEHGVPDEKGSLFLELDEEVEGYRYLKRQKATSIVFNPDNAEKILQKKGLYDECVVMVPVIDQDKVLALSYEGKLTAREMAKIMEEKVTYSTRPWKD